MSVWITLFFAVFLTGGALFGLYALVLLVIETKRHKASPRLGIVPGEKEGTLSFWITWDPSQFALEFYRVKLTHFSPESLVKEGVLSVSFDPPQKAPFLQPVELPEAFKELLTAGQVGRKAMLTLEMKTIDGFVISKNYFLSKVKAIYLGQKRLKAPEINKLEPAKVDVPAVSSLDFTELVARKKKLKVLAEEAKKKAAAKPVAKPAAATAEAPAAPVDKA